VIISYILFGFGFPVLYYNKREYYYPKVIKLSGTRCNTIKADTWQNILIMRAYCYGVPPPIFLLIMKLLKVRFLELLNLLNHHIFNYKIFVCVIQERSYGVK
jgi:hypothetical protein